MAALLSVSYFLTTLFFSLILFVFWVRVLLRYYRVSSLHPIAQLVYGFTNPLLSPLEKLLYPQKKRVPRYDWAGFAAIILIECLKFTMVGFIVYQKMIPLVYLLLLVFGDIIVQPCNLLFYALLIRIVLSWVNPQWQQHPAADILKIVTNPLLRIGQKVVPNISGFDFSPFIAMILLKVISLFISASMPIPLL